MEKPELLSPAGSLKNMRYAFAYGADAVYAGQPRYSLRVRNNEFNHQNLKIAIDEAHSLGKKLYVVVNIAPHNSKLKTFITDMERIVEMGPDALIMSDPGLIMLVRENFPDTAIHLSVQANAVNWASCKFWYSMGVERVILSRELSLDEIEEIRTKVPEIELEIFVHGALCMAYSGRCLLSGYMNKRDPNQGTCTNACRWQYDVKEGVEDEVGQIIELKNINQEQIIPTLGQGQPTRKSFLLTESNRPGEEMTAYEDEHGTYIMNSRDLRAVEHVPRLSKIGVHSLKIEGRTKSFYYCARTAQVYRRAIDEAAQGKEFDPKLLVELDNLANRGYTDGFLQRHNHDLYQNYETGNSISEQQQFVGAFTGERHQDNAEFALVEVKNKFLVGDSLEIMTPQGNFNIILDKLFNKKLQSTDVAPGVGHYVWVEIDPSIDVNYGLVLRNLTGGATTRNPNFEKLADNNAKITKLD